jgi:hypothetical protein
MATPMRLEVVLQSLRSASAGGANARLPRITAALNISVLGREETAGID